MMGIIVIGFKFGERALFMDYHGIHVALCTPFRGGGKAVDHRRLRALVNDQIRNGIHGLIPCGSTGEFPALTNEERRAVTDTVCDAAKGRVPVTVGVGAMSTAEAVGLARHAKKAGADAVMVVGPYYEEPTEDELRDYVAAIAGDGGLPVLLYNNPAGTGYNLSTQFIAELSRMPEVVAIKDTTHQAARIEEIRHLCGNRVQILSGQDTLQYVGFVSGARASVWGAPNAVPAACAALFERIVTRGDLIGGRKLWGRLYPVNRFLEAEGYVASVKAGAQIRGVEVGPPRLPIKPLGDKPRARLAKLMAQLDKAMA
jgi:4-hydroxy-tetrahydrodipicolinate synthase